MIATAPCVRCAVSVENPPSLATLSVGVREIIGPVCEECQRLVMTNPQEFWGAFPGFNPPRDPHRDAAGLLTPPLHVWVSFAVWCAMVFLAGMTVGMLIAR